jgi:hypothetical protein
MLKLGDWMFGHIKGICLSWAAPAPCLRTGDHRLHTLDLGLAIVPNASAICLIPEMHTKPRFPGRHSMNLHMDWI